MKKLLLLVASVATLCGCSQPQTLPLLDAADFEATVDGKQTSLYTLKGGNLVMQVTNFGGRVVTLWTPDREGVMEDIVLGYNNIDTYINNPDMELSSVAIDLMSDRHQLSKIHTKYQVIERDVDRLNELIPRAVFELKDAILMRRIEELRNALRHLQSASANDEVLRVMEQIAQYMEVRKSLALYLGERIIPAKTK